MTQNSQPSAKKRRGSGKPFAKGRSGNPGGRPKLEGDVRDFARANTLEVMERLLRLTRSDNERVAVAAIQVMLDRGWGKPRQEMEVSGSMQVLWPLSKHPLEGP